jgi:hypothetical protein
LETTHQALLGVCKPETLPRWPVLTQMTRN